jgi:hypothetical protein
VCQTSLCPPVDYQFVLLSPLSHLFISTGSFKNAENEKNGSQLDTVSTQIVTLSSKLKLLSSPGEDGGKRGNCFEKILATRLALMGWGGLAIFYRLLDDPVSQRHVVTIKVRHRIFVSANDPPKNCFDFTEGTLLTHTDQNGGEARVESCY